MKKILLIITLAILIAGCTTNKQIIAKSTVFGFQASTPAVAGTGAMLIQIGLVRSEYVSNPTSTTNVYAAPLTTHVQANLNPLTQSATEDIGTK